MHQCTYAGVENVNKADNIESADSDTCGCSAPVGSRSGRGAGSRFDDARRRHGRRGDAAARARSRVRDGAVEARATSPREAQRQNASAMTEVQKRLADARIPKDAIRTLGYGLEQEFDFVQTRRVPRGFVARNSVEARVDDVARVGEILDAVVQGGATSVSNIRFDLQDRATVEREALRLAVADARARAEAAASGAGRTIDRIIRIEDAREGRVLPPPRPMAAMAMRSEAAQETPIEPGVIEVRARVTLTASMK
jgi:uncharacterized protein YggE